MGVMAKVRAEEALRASERDLQVMVETIPGNVWCATPSGEVEFVNKGTDEFFHRIGQDRDRFFVREL
jgi:PAS domain-containing protein